MVGETDRNSDPVAKEKAEFHRQQTSGNQSPPRHWSLTVTFIIVGGFATIAGLVRPIVNPPHDIWVVTFGVACVVGGMAVGLHEILRNWGKTIAAFAVLLILLVVIVADRWTRDFRTAQLIAENPQAVPTVIPEAQFQPPRFEPAVTPYVLIDAGTVITPLLRSKLAACPPYTPGSQYPLLPTFPIPLTLDGLDPISVCVENNRVFVNVQLSDEGGTQTEIIHDHFTIEPTDWDWNFDDEAFEAVDDTQRPVLQLIYRSPSDILVNGVFSAGGVGAVLTRDGSTINFPVKDLPNVRARPDRQIKRIFKYPHEKYLHVRE